MANSRALYIIILLFTLFNLLFINKALHIDDPYSIKCARAILDSPAPTHPALSTNPPLLGYYYAPIIKLFGEREIWLHIFSLPFSILAIIAMFFLCKRFCNGSVFPILFLLSTPAFVVTSQSIMLDMPALALSLSALALFIYGIDSNKGIPLLSSGILAGAAMLTKYSGFLLLPLFLIYGILYAKDKKMLLALLIPVIIFIIWDIHNLVSYSRSLSLFTLQWVWKRASFNGLPLRIIASLSFLSGTSIIAFFIVPCMLRKKSGIVLFCISFLSGTIPFLLRGIFNDYTLPEKTCLAFLIVVSTTMILLITERTLASFGKDKDAFFLGIWFLISLAAVILFIFVAARFVLVIFPPMFLLAFRMISPLNNPRKRLFSAAAAISFILAAIIAIGDYQFAGVYREFSNDVKKGAVDGRNKAFLYAGDWGYNYYVIQQGLDRIKSKTLSSYSSHGKIPKAGLKLIEDMRPDASHGIVLVMPEQPVLPTVGFGRKELFWQKIADLGWHKSEIKREVYFSGIILHHTGYKTGFYSHDWGLLPFKFKRKAVLEEFSFYRLMPRNDN
ncbi:MAG: glycosyltransferase family 39 protein [Candidatus Omnitrophica bacterium]|nr:glycosyltransferase family 39 protein [Candidatus Omnitrophota bacterium]